MTQVITTTTSGLRIYVRWMIRRDEEYVLEIEHDCFGDHSWSEDELVCAGRQRNIVRMVAENCDAKIIGYMIYELHKDRLHLINFAVAKPFQRRGVGRAMIEKLTGKLSLQRRSRILLEVRDSNLAAQQFFRACGFRAVSVLRNFYCDIDDDAYLFQYRVGLPEFSNSTVQVFDR